jgi:hypothetical protein
MNIRKHILCSASTIAYIALTSHAAHAQENRDPNGNYTHARISLNGTSFATPICVGYECHHGMDGAGIDVAYQIIPNVSISLSSNASQSTGRQYTLKSSGGAVYIAFIAGLGNLFDVGAAIGSISATSNICSATTSTCATYSDTGSAAGLFGKAWLNGAKNVNIGLGLDTYSYSKEAEKYYTTSFSISFIPADNHEFDLTGWSTNDSNGYEISTGTSLGYKYLFDHGWSKSRRPAKDSQANQLNEPDQLTEISQKKSDEAAANSTSRKLRDLKALKNEGLIDEADYQAKKQQLLEKM